MTCQVKPTAVLGLFALAASGALAQPVPRLEFEVASIEPAASMKGGEMMSVDAGRLDYSNVALRDCIRVAYRIKDYQVEGPDWLAGARFDIVAKLPGGATRGPGAGNAAVAAGRPVQADLPPRDQRSQH